MLHNSITPAPRYPLMKHPLLYEINTRCWLNQLSSRQGAPVTLANVPDSEFARWQRLGFTHIWLMGVWTTGARARAQALALDDLLQEYQDKLPQAGKIRLDASPYAIGEYRVSPALGGEPGLQAFRRQLSQCGLKLILDFVPNHVGLDHPWLSQRPDLFVQGSAEMPGTIEQQTKAGVRWLAQGRDPNFPPWSDTVQLDYRLPATRAAMQETLLSFAGKCDGVRCDMAMLVLNDVFEKTWAQFPPVETGGGFRKKAANAGGVLTTAATPESVGTPSRGAPATEFWQEAIASAKQAHPGFIFIAEAYWGLEPRLHALGFDYTYDKELYDALVGHDSAGVQRHLLAATPRLIEAGAHFLENHDEPRIASILSLPEHCAAALLILSLPGMRFLHDGELEGALVRIPVQLLCSAVEPTQPDIERMYEQMLIALQKTAVGQGEAVILKPREAWPGNATAQNFVLVQWQVQAPDFELAVVNLAPQRSQCYAPLSVGDLAGHDWLMKNLLGSEEYRRSGKELQSQGIYLDLPEHGAQLFHFEPGSST